MRVDRHGLATEHHASVEGHGLAGGQPEPAEQRPRRALRVLTGDGRWQTRQFGAYGGLTWPCGQYVAITVSWVCSRSSSNSGSGTGCGGPSLRLERTTVWASVVRATLGTGCGRLAGQVDRPGAARRRRSTGAVPASASG